MVANTTPTIQTKQSLNGVQGMLIRAQQPIVDLQGVPPTSDCMIVAVGKGIDRRNGMSQNNTQVRLPLT